MAKGNASNFGGKKAAPFASGGGRKKASPKTATGKKKKSGKFSKMSASSASPTTALGGGMFKSKGKVRTSANHPSKMTMGGQAGMTTAKSGIANSQPW